MPTAIDVANFFIDLYRGTDSPMTNLEVQKYVFEAQAWSLVKFGKPLFEEDVEAWEYGPVIPSIYSKLKRYGMKNVTKTIGDRNRLVFSDEEKMLLINVARRLEQFTPAGLINLTHVDGGPWSRVYVKGEKNIVIPKESMRRYYSHMDLGEFDIKTVLKNRAPAWPRDAAGRTIVPHDLDD